MLPETPKPTPVRLQKFLADCGVASRRHAEVLIQAGRVTVNGSMVTTLGSKVQPDTDRVAMGGRPVVPPTTCRTIMLNKPRGYVCSASALDGRIIYELLEAIPERLTYAGRLDKDSEGIVILSNDGDLVQRLTHPRFDPEKVYQVTVSGTVDSAVLNQLNAPMEIDGYRTQPAQVRVLRPSAKTGRTLLSFILREGRNRQIRRMCEAVGLTINRLVRVQIKALPLGNLQPGQWRELTPGEISRLRGA
jgi:23S rRNA pseudouridine2605 synthase